MIYRTMREEDIHQAVQMEKQIFSRPWTKENFLESIELSNTLFLVAQQMNTGEVVGYCGCYQSFDEGNITNVAVKPEMRRQGIARNLLVNVLERGRNLGICKFYLEVRVSNVPAIRLYESFGFRKEGLRKNFYVAPLEDAYLMILDIVGNNIE